MYFIQEYVRDNENSHMERDSYKFTLAKLSYPWEIDYDNLIIKNLPSNKRKW